MGFSASGGSKGVKSEINVTPLVDVVLVLLIVFLVAMPIVMRNIQLDIPKKSTEVQPPDLQPDQVVVEVQKGDIVVLNGQTIDRTQLAEKLRIKLEHKREKIVFVDFDLDYRYGDAVSIMDTVKGAGATTIGLKIKDENPTGAAPTPAPGSPTVAPAQP